MICAARSEENVPSFKSLGIKGEITYVSELAGDARVEFEDKVKQYGGSQAAEFPKQEHIYRVDAPNGETYFVGSSVYPAKEGPKVAVGFTLLVDEIRRELAYVGLAGGVPLLNELKRILGDSFVAFVLESQKGEWRRLKQFLRLRNENEHIKAVLRDIDKNTNNLLPVVDALPIAPEQLYAWNDMLSQAGQNCDAIKGLLAPIITIDQYRGVARLDAVSGKIRRIYRQRWGYIGFPDLSKPGAVEQWLIEAKNRSIS